MREHLAKRLAPYRSSIFEEMNSLAARHNAVNLGPGTPCTALPEIAAQALAEAVSCGHNQYSPVSGEPALRQAVARHSARFYGQRIDPLTEITITSGVTEGIQAAMTAFIEAGDEVIVIEPCYESYAPSIAFTGGVPVPVRLRPPDFQLDPIQLERAFSSRTRALILNNPQNPTGKVFSHEELQVIAELCCRFDVLAVTDEVYEHIVFDGRRHIRLSSLPEMWERTLTLSGAGKTFSCTGWRIGWAIGPARMQNALNVGRQFSVFCAATPLQLAVARCLDLDDFYFSRVAAEYQNRRDILVAALAGSPFPAIFRPQGSFFVLAGFDAAAYENARDCCLGMARDFGVVPVPLDTFYIDSGYIDSQRDPLIRFAFSQPPEVLLEAGRRLRRAAKVTATCT